MFDINNNLISFDEPLNDWFKDEISLHFERDRRVFEDNKITADFKIRKVKYNNFFLNYLIINTRQLNLADFSNNSQWQEANGVLQNKDIGDSQSATLEGTFDNITTISFDCKVSSEEHYDFLTIYINGEQKVNISGEVDWQTYTYTINGNLDFKAVYSKDGSTSEGTDTGYLRNIVIIQKTQVIIEPMKFVIKSYKNINTLQKNTFISYNNIINNPKFTMIRKFNNNVKFAFERIGFKEIPPKRVIIKDFDD